MIDNLLNLLVDLLYGRSKKTSPGSVSEPAYERPIPYQIFPCEGEHFQSVSVMREERTSIIEETVHG